MPEHGKRYITQDGTITGQILKDKGIFTAKYQKYDCQWSPQGECIGITGAPSGFEWDSANLKREATEQEIKEAYEKENKETLLPPPKNALHKDVALIVCHHGAISKQSRIAEVGAEVVATLIRKNIDYGSSVFDSPVLCPNMPAKSSILVRMSDKIKRIQQLQQNEAQVKSESFEDTMRDLAGYAILYLASPEEKHEHQPRATKE